MSTPLRLLIVDDDDAFRLALKSAMDDSGYSVESCDCGEAGINILRASVFDVVILDYRMPGMRVWILLPAIISGLSTAMISFTRKCSVTFTN